MTINKAPGNRQRAFRVFFFGENHHEASARRYSLHRSPCRRIAADNGYKITYDGGSIPDVKTGSPLRLHLNQSQIELIGKGDAGVAMIPVGAVTEISYGQDVHRRVGAAIGLAVVSFGIGALMALTKSKKHFIGLTWDDGGKKGGIAFQASKNDYRGVLAGLEGVTGKRAINSDTMTVKN